MLMTSIVELNLSHHREAAWHAYYVQRNLKFNVSYNNNVFLYARISVGFD